MPRAPLDREPATPRTPAQIDRCDRILATAALLGARYGLEEVRMQDVADQSAVSITTVYRYYPTKHHLFAALLFHLTQTAAPPGPTTGHPVADVTEFMAGIIRNMLARPLLARAMITSVNARRAESTVRGDYNLRRNILGVAGIAAPTADQTQIATTWMIKFTQQGEYGLASALGFITMGVLVVFTGLYLALLTREKKS